MKILNRVIFIGLLIVIFSQNALAQNEKFKALFMYNFTKYLEWPESERQGNFVIVVLGETSLADELKIIAEKKKVGFQTIVIHKISSLDQLPKCHIIYIPDSKTSLINEIKNKLASSSTVIIADNPGAIAKGAGINYVVSSGKQLFEISKTNLEQHSIKVGADLLALGIQK
ncbi:MAG: hypothetical protein A2W99_02500 [Bacteroidetes bacterium GWF2_33_16]|nr:MAG: hypothetical protein A2X00_15655 [Bacteroidetes bacterium GWE2_32_14]OFY07131.1 MAG: hypothetical protein A2W99_02500 [Bacteroidetes bacterium GWF2_33_16]